MFIISMIKNILIILLIQISIITLAFIVFTVLRYSYDKNFKSIICECRKNNVKKNKINYGLYIIFISLPVISVITLYALFEVNLFPEKLLEDD